MNIKSLSYSVIGCMLLGSTVTSCVDETYRDKAKSKAAEYLDGYEFLKAERFAKQQHKDYGLSSDEVAYWDSLLIDAKEKEAYFKGQQLIRDSMNNIHHRKSKYEARLDTIIDYGFLDNVKDEYSRYTDAKTFLQKRAEAPTTNSSYNQLPYETHYWNLITMAGRQQKAFNKGMEDVRKIVKQSIDDN